jgi:transcription factor C subunit 6
LFTDVSYRQYVAVGAHPSAYTPKIGTKVSRPSLSNIQIWSFGLEEGKPTTRCEALLCIESGHTNELKWCPLPSHDPVSWVFPRNTSFSLRIISSERRAARVNLVNWVYLLEPSRMGRSPYLLFRIQKTSSRKTPQVQFMVRSGIPSSLSSFTHETTILVKVDPVLRIELQDTSCWSFDWANSEVVAIGCTNGEAQLKIFPRSPDSSTRGCGGLQRV